MQQVKPFPHCLKLSRTQEGKELLQSCWWDNLLPQRNGVDGRLKCWDVVLTVICSNSNKITKPNRDREKQSCWPPQIHFRRLEKLQVSERSAEAVLVRDISSILSQNISLYHRRKSPFNSPQKVGATFVYPWWYVFVSDEN